MDDHSYINFFTCSILKRVDFIYLISRLLSGSCASANSAKSSSFDLLIVPLVLSIISTASAQKVDLVVCHFFSSRRNSLFAFPTLSGVRKSLKLQSVFAATKRCNCSMKRNMRIVLGLELLVWGLYVQNY